jgi:predicted nucleotidyltransferase component of viral defense system
MFHRSTVDLSTFQLLQSVFKIDFVKSNFALAGGTSLALQVGHRKSIDLDFFSEKKFSTRELEIILTDSTTWKYEASGISERMLFCFLNRVKCDFVNEPFPLIEPFIEEEGILLYSLKDIAAMKLHTICGRGKKKDFFDVYVLMQLFGWKQLLKWFEQKYGGSQLFFLWKSIIYFSDAEDDVDIRGIAPYTVSWGEVKEYILKNCR